MSVPNASTSSALAKIFSGKTVIAIIDTTTEDKDHPLSDPAISITEYSPLEVQPTTKSSPLFELPPEIRNLIYTSLLCLETRTGFFTTEIDQVRGTVSIMPPPERAVSRRFCEEIGYMHGIAMTCAETYRSNAASDMDRRKFPKTIGLQLEIENPLEWITVSEKVQWADSQDYPPFKTIPKIYKKEMEVLLLECFLAPNLHLVDGSRMGNERETLLDEWILSLGQWICGLLEDAERLERVELRLLFDGAVEDLERHLDVFLEVPCMRRVELVYECRLGSRILLQCAEGWPFLKRVEATLEEEGWVVDRLVY